ncbi:hypothetical protein [Saccharothrix syringae]|uniref:hypothetical protein n=1 Tax=Saccharothrix syringae TaxID=103733 RepID=UPI000A818F17|nr:hypothetical protein [Saccharothrix syringae]
MSRGRSRADGGDPEAFALGLAALREELAAHREPSAERRPWWRRLLRPGGGEGR